MSLKHALTAAGIFAAGLYAGYSARTPVVKPGKITVLAHTDTVTVVKPVAVDVATVRHVDVDLPSLPDSDTVRVVVPIESKVYEGPDYRAVVSGFRASLDSITMFRRHTVVTVPSHTPRFSVGIQAGYGITPRGFQPYIGIGVEFRFVAF